MAKIMVGYSKNVEIYDNDHCPDGMQYLEDLSNDRLDELLSAADRAPDRDFHFSAISNGREYEYVIIRRGENEYELKSGAY